MILDSWIFHCVRAGSRTPRSRGISLLPGCGAISAFKPQVQRGGRRGCKGRSRGPAPGAGGGAERAPRRARGAAAAAAAAPGESAPPPSPCPSPRPRPILGGGPSAWGRGQVQRHAHLLPESAGAAALAGRPGGRASGPRKGGPETPRCTPTSPTDPSGMGIVYLPHGS